MKRILSFVLLLMVGLPLISPVFGLSADAQTDLAACCRRNGAHHCMSTQAEMDALLHGTHVSQVHGKCPLYPAVARSNHREQLSFNQHSALIVDAFSHPARHGQVEDWTQPALEGEQHKRGPPSIRLS